MGRKVDRRRKKHVPVANIEARKTGLVITVTRRDLLISQLDSAIRMWFFKQDPVPIHLLLMPAYHVLCDLGRRNDKGPDIGKHVKDVDGGYDWMRHASSDPHDFIDFPPRTNEFLMWSCTISFEKLFGGRTAYMMAFQAFFVLWLVPEDPKFREGASASMPKGMTVEQASALGRLEFFDKLTEMFAADILRRSKS